MKNNPAQTSPQNLKNSSLSGRLPSASPEPKQAAPQSPQQKVETRPDTTLDVQLSSKLRDHSQPSNSAPVKPRQAAAAEAYHPRSRDIVTRFMTWVANAMKKLERRFLQRLETLPLLKRIIVPQKRDEDREEFQ